MTCVASLDQTCKATLDALEDFDYRIISAQKHGTAGEIEAKRGSGDSVKVKPSVSGPGTTPVKTPVRIFEDEVVSRSIERKITLTLGFWHNRIEFRL